ncbi:hypothetical protein D6C84_10447 [Aureobasidium pullulans]|uniref:Uncharacterized protein n=1 Tax=Aureobasidium pullulans TaxID=5580 RepID=A0A4S9Q8M1_AURPU|nr:hypothetical protein D6C95_09563 [Aureobasidium pullulans]THZ70368.1 hypothetical protein D6C84_10447 [Aureobasidium pullulans]
MRTFKPTILLLLPYLSSFVLAHAPESGIHAIISSAADEYNIATSAISSILSIATASAVSNLSVDVQDITAFASSVYEEVTAAVGSVVDQATGKINNAFSEATGSVGSSISKATASTTPTKQVTGKENPTTISRAPGSGTVKPTSVSEGKIRRGGNYADGVLAAVFAAVALL